MNVYFITFRSITYAQRGKAILDQSGISNTMGRTPKWMEEKGCGYSLRIPAEVGAAAVGLLERWRVPYNKIYRRGAGERLEEVER